MTLNNAVNKIKLFMQKLNKNKMRYDHQMCALCFASFVFFLVSRSVGRSTGVSLDSESGNW